MAVKPFLKDLSNAHMSVCIGITEPVFTQVILGKHRNFKSI